MKFYLPILIAAVAAWLAGALWYMAFGRTWMVALGVTPEAIAAEKNKPGHSSRSSTPLSPNW